MKSSVIGIIGGMGPMATLDLFHKIVINTPANCDQDHAHLIIDNNTKIPDRSSYILNGGDNPATEIFNSACRLLDSGADVLIMPCNTAHYFYDTVKEKIDEKYKDISYRFINMIDETAKFIQSSGCKEAYLLATKGTYQSMIYQDALMKYGIPMEEPDETIKDVIMKVTYNYKEGINHYYEDELKRIVEAAKFQGEIEIILGCTELPIIFKELDLLDNTIDPTEILARSALEAINLITSL